MRTIPREITKELMEKLYLDEKKSVLDIARLKNKSIRQISRYLKRFDIPTRPFSTKGLQIRLGAVLSQETKDKIRKAHLGTKQSLDTKIKKSKYRGELSGGWIDGRTSVNRKVRGSLEYQLWRKSVFERDNWTCQKCGKHGGYIHAHHKKPFSKYPEFRTSIENGITLCVKCHRAIHST